MVEVMKIMATSFTMSHAYTATLSAPNPAAGHHQLTPLPETPGHSQASLSQSPVGVTAPFSWVPVHTGSVCTLLESVSQSCVSSGGSVVGLMATSSQRAYAIPKSAAPRAPALRQPLLTRTSAGDTQTQLCLSLCGLSGSWHAQGLFESSERVWWV